MLNKSLIRISNHITASSHHHINMKPFNFQKFTVLQSKEVFRVGTDGVLLGILSNAEKARNVLEVGTGTGLVSLMITQRNSVAKILAIDINEEAVKLAAENFKNSPFSDRLQVNFQDFKHFETVEKFDFIVCNPPFFEENNSEKDVLARQQITLTFRNLIESSAKVLSEEGIFSVIIPSDVVFDFENLAKEFHLNLIRKVNIFGIEGGGLKRNILEFSSVQKPLVIIDFTIEKSPRKYSDQYLELTAAFHVFKK